nr:cupin domain-containing protein [uncultured Sphingorhabdus sp.]
MSTRRIIATNINGRSVVAEDATAPTNLFTAVPGFDPAVIWGTSSSPTIPWDGVDLAATAPTVMPEVGGTRLFVVKFPPDSVMAEPNFDPMAAGAEYMQRLPGLAELFEPENPGMHTSDTVDYDIVLDGKITVEFDDGAKVELNKGDILVQYGTRHAWRNESSETATMIFVLVGATRK